LIGGRESKYEKKWIFAEVDDKVDLKVMIITINIRYKFT
jgi:hypothetical protein